MLDTSRSKFIFFGSSVLGSPQQNVGLNTHMYIGSLSVSQHIVVRCLKEYNCNHINMVLGVRNKTYSETVQYLCVTLTVATTKRIKRNAV